MAGFSVILESIVFIGILIAIGYTATKLGYISLDIKNALSKVVVRLTLPFSIINSLTNIELDKSLLKNIGFVIISAFLVILVLYNLAGLFAKLLGMSEKTALCHKVMSAFGNVSFLGYPLVLALFGDIGLFYAAVYTFANDIFVWTFVIFKFQKEKTDLKGTIKNCLNPPTIAFLVSIVMVVFGLKFFGILNKLSTTLASCTVPLSMIFIGGTLAEVNLKSLLNQASTLLIVLFKMLIIPILLILATKNLPFDNVVKGALIMEVALPSQTIISVIAKEYGGDVDYVIKCIFTTTVLGLVTLPFIYYLFTIL